MGTFGTSTPWQSTTQRDKRRRTVEHPSPRRRPFGHASRGYRRGHISDWPERYGPLHDSSDSGAERGEHRPRGYRMGQHQVVRGLRALVKPQWVATAWTGALDCFGASVMGWAPGQGEKDRSLRVLPLLAYRASNAGC
jgi:hypothetical protein